MKISDLIDQAQRTNIKIYLQGGQIKVDIPWPVESIPDPVHYVLSELKKRQEEILFYLDPKTQEEYWQVLLTNAYFLYYPRSDGKYESMKPLHSVLENLKQRGAKLIKVEEGNGYGRVIKLELEQGNISDPEWNKIQTMLSPHENQMNWLFTLSVMGAAKDYVDLANYFPVEWIENVLKKNGSQIAKLRMEIIKKTQGYGIISTKNGQTYCLAPGKTGRQDAIELTPEESYIVFEAQSTGMLPPGEEAARNALKH